MRIQHNIMAMNAYRNYNNNNKALSGNLEKLSSGYKINRAGDDAAGLAISEKMRAQITGLEAAQKNVKDGISLVKTAEGAMQEIQDMLNRMDYLATQSANGTYQDEVDREALQKEVNQLNDEINRIADSANFNGIKLLDGTWDTDAIAKAKEAVEAAKQPVIADAVYTDKTADEIKGLMLPLGNAAPNGPTDVGNKTVLETEKVEFQSPSFQVSLNGNSYIMATDGTQDSASGVDFDGEGVKLTVGGKDILLTEEDMKAYLDTKGVTAKAGLELSAKDLAAAFEHKISNDTATTGVGAGSAPTDIVAGSDIKGLFNDGTNVWNVKADGENLVFEFNEDANNKPTSAQNKYFDTSIADTITNEDVKATGGTTTYSVTDGTKGGNATTGSAEVTLKATIGGKEVTFGTEAVAAGDADAAGIKAALDTLVAAEGTDADGNKYKFSDYFSVSLNGQDIVFTDKTTGEKGSGNTVTMTLDTTKQTVDTGGTAATLGTAATAKGTDAYSTGLDGYINAGTEVVIPGVPSKSDQLASTSLDFSKLDITDGMKIKLGNTEYTFAVGADSKFKDAENVVDLTNLEAKNLKATGGVAADRATALSKLSEVAKDNDVFTVSHEATGTDSIGLKQKAEAKDSTDMTTMDGFASYIGISTVDDAKTAEAQKEVDAAQAEKLADAEAKLAELEAKGAKTLNLQIGDTSDDWNQLGVKIGSMKTTALGVDGLSIATAEDAKAAIDTIKGAINYVSSVRGDLGAYQNRLEHTGNNLSVMAENIQDAESTIRDTDVAEEMMSYVKNNILVQSAQAMLAQANQVPQGVLQLLG